VVSYHLHFPEYPASHHLKGYEKPDPIVRAKFGKDIKHANGKHENKQDYKKVVDCRILTGKRKVFYSLGFSLRVKKFSDQVLHLQVPEMLNHALSAEVDKSFCLRAEQM
jgi:hypothetical protein